jgi:hypothetical protein
MAKPYNLRLSAQSRSAFNLTYEGYGSRAFEPNWVQLLMIGVRKPRASRHLVRYVAQYWLNTQMQVIAAFRVRQFRRSVPLWLVPMGRFFLIIIAISIAFVLGIAVLVTYF